MMVNGKLEVYQKFSTDFLGGGFKHFLFSPLFGGKMNPFWRAYFSKGLNPPIPRCVINDCFDGSLNYGGIGDI